MDEWIVMGLDGQSTGHPTKDAARKAAEQKASKKPGVYFYVYQLNNAVVYEPRPVWKGGSCGA